jgi:8-oxo-dGTP pyrophosphatase MutT (NUDIX family)
MNEAKQYPEPVVGLYIIYGNEIAIVKSPKWKGWRVPGGHVDYGEDILHAARREAKEELGIDVAPLGMLNIAQSIRPADLNGKTRHFIFFEILCQAKGKEVTIDNREISECRWVPLDKAEELFESDISKKVIRAYNAKEKPEFIEIL